MKYCCDKFAKSAGEMTSRSPLASAYPPELRSKAQFEKEAGKDWAINGCCGGGCYVVVDMKFCPYCGAKL